MKDYWEEPKTKKLNTKKIVIITAIILLFLMIIILVSLYIFNKDVRNWIDIQVFRKEISQDKVASIELEEIQTTNVYAFNKYIGILNKNKFSIYGASGHEETALEVQINTPIFDSANRFLVIGESNGQKIIMIEDKKIIWEKEIDGNISQVYVNKNGYVATIIVGTSHKSIVQVFNPEGTPLFKIYLASTMAVDVSISNDNKYLAIAEVDTSGTIIQSNIRIISMEKAKTDPINSEEKKYQSDQNKLIINIEYQDKNSIVCMYTDSINKIENDQNTIIFENKDKKVIAQSITLENNCVAVEEEKSGIFTANSVLNIINVNDGNIKKYTIESAIKEIYAKGNIIAVNLGTEVEFVNTSGWLVKRYIASQEVTKVTISNNIAAIVYRDKVEIINL